MLADHHKLIYRLAKKNYAPLLLFTVVHRVDKYLRYYIYCTIPYLLFLCSRSSSSPLSVWFRATNCEPSYNARLHQKCRHLRASETNRPILPPPGAPTLLGGVSHRRYQPESSPRGIGFDVGRLALVRRPEEKGIEGEEADEDDATEEDKTEG